MCSGGNSNWEEGPGHAVRHGVRTSPLTESGTKGTDREIDARHETSMKPGPTEDAVPVMSKYVMVQNSE